MRVAGNFDVFSVLDHSYSFELQRFSHRLNTAAANRAGGISATDDLRRDKERDFVYEASIEKLARNRRAAFNQDTLKRTGAKLV